MVHNVHGIRGIVRRTFIFHQTVISARRDSSFMVRDIRYIPRVHKHLTDTTSKQEHASVRYPRTYKV